MGRYTKIIAEVSSNHGGDISLAKEFIRIAAEIGVDYIKFQSWQADKLKDGFHDPQYEWLKRSELSDRAHFELAEECEKRKIKFLTTIFDIERIPFISKIITDVIKVGSAEAFNLDFLRELRKKFRHIIVSTGLVTDNEIRNISDILSDEFTLMHTNSLYPTPIENSNLNRIYWLKQFTNSVGYSDHTIGTEVVKIAIAIGASYVEKHFCLGKYGPGRASPWDATPTEMEAILKYAERVETIKGYEKREEDEAFSNARTKYFGRFAGKME